jgi:hypothetical protein
MSLDNLNKNLYDANKGVDSFHPHEKNQYDPTLGGVSGSPFDEKRDWEQNRKQLNPYQKRVLTISLVSLGVVVLVVGGFVFSAWWQKNAFHQDRVAISFEGPREADSNNIVKYLIHYKNSNPIKLNNAEIQLSYAENFQPIDNVNVKYLNSTNSRIFVGDIPAGGEGVAEIKGIFYAPKDFPVYLHASIQYIPSNGKTQFAMDAQTSVNITTSPVILDVSAPAQAVDGDKIEYVIDYKNLDLRSLSNVEITVQFPESFQLSEALPEPSQDNSHWVIGNLESNQGGKIRIKGILRGGNDENKPIVVSMGKLSTDGQLAIYNKRETSTKIISPILTVTQELGGASGDNIIKAGDMLRYTIKYRNTGTVGLRNVIVTAEIQSKILDFSKVTAEKGFFDGSKNIITWKASDIPALANINPNEGGQLNFSVPVKLIIPVVTSNDKNFTVATIAKIDSPDIPVPTGASKIIGSNKLELKLASKVILETKGFYNDAKIKNTGPIPLQVNNETLFAVHWSLANISNDLVEVKIISSLPSGVRWTGLVYPENEYVTYDARTNQLIWSVGKLSAGTGLISPVQEVEFQVGVTPQINQVGQLLNLLNAATLTGTDTFTGKSLTIESAVKNTQLTEDPVVGNEGGKVVE